MKGQSIIIFEGPDGCGKSNIASELSGILDIPVFKNESEWEHFPKGNKTDYFLNAIRFAHPHLLQYFKQTSTSVILDRAYPSELVYSRIFGRDTDESALRYCDNICAEMGAKIIIPFRTSYANVIDQFDFVDEEFLKKVHDGYMAFLSWTNCDTYLLNVDDENLKREMDDITEFLEGNVQ